MTTEKMNLIEKLYQTHDLSDDGFLCLLGGMTEAETQLLYEKARLAATKVYQKQIYLRGLIEFTNICKNNK